MTATTSNFDLPRMHFAGAISLDEMWFDAEQRFGLSLRVAAC